MLGRVAVVASLALVACSNAAEIKKLAAERRADIEAALAPYRDIPKVLDKTPPFPELVRLGAPTHPLRFDTQRNAIILHAEDLAHLGSPGPVPLRIEGANPSAGGWTLPSQLAHPLATGEWKNTTVLNDLKSFEIAFENMQRFGHALVIRTASYTPARPTGERTFEPARLRGDAVLISLRDRKVLGGFPLDIKGQWRTLSSRPGPIRGSEIVDDLKDKSELDVKSQLGFALGAGTEALLGGEGDPPYASSFFSPDARAEQR
jgi:hypothetical protein